MMRHVLGIAFLLFAAYCLAQFVRRCRIGTRSCLYGYHTFWLHGWFVARGWYALYGFAPVRIGTKTVYHELPLLDERRKNRITMERAIFTSLSDPKLWLAFFIHDLGYWGKPNMDGEEGERHPEWAARRMARFGLAWGELCLYHSRFYAKKHEASPSALCYADKLAITYYPEWLMVRLVSWTGEVREYMKDAQRQNPGAYGQDELQPGEVLKWFRGVKVYVINWVDEHKDGRIDTWTAPGGHGARGTLGTDGVWR